MALQDCAPLTDNTLPLSIGITLLRYKLAVKIHWVIIGLNLYLNFQTVILCLIDHFSNCFFLSLVRCTFPMERELFSW